MSLLTKDDRLDFRLEVADLQKDATESMANIRTKWKRHHGLSRAEWIFLAQYIQTGCEETSESPDLPLRESYASLLEATLAVRSLRADRGIELDRYYLGNLMPYSDAALNERRLDPDVVPQTVESLIRGLRTGPSTPKPTFAGRNFYVALRDETLPNYGCAERDVDGVHARVVSIGRPRSLDTGAPTGTRAARGT